MEEVTRQISKLKDAIWDFKQEIKTLRKQLINTQNEIDDLTEVVNKLQSNIIKKE